MEQTPDDVKSSCEGSVTALFPDICRDYFSHLAEKSSWNAELIIDAVVGDIDVRGSYPKRDRPNLKRKRQSDASQAEAVDPIIKYSSDAHKQAYKPAGYRENTKMILQQHFPMVTVKTIWETMKLNNGCLFPTLLALDKALDGPEMSRGFALKKVQAKKNNGKYTPDKIDYLLRQDSTTAVERAVLTEYKAALSVKTKKKDEERRELEEKENLENARASGTAMECECCCDEFTADRMVHCNGDILHWFCVECSRRNAETQIGLSKYQLNCMSMDGCTADFSNDQIEIFLDEKTKLALDRIEQETVLRLAGMEDLDTCPSCPFAAILPPVEVDREFRCLNPDCEQVSCRLCRQETHIPKTCAEAAKDRGHSARRVIEEAMSEAMIRRCNKCAMPFVKESGCNKMTCSRPGCRNVQCYICHASCDYSHFNDVNRGGKAGNCPLFDHGRVDDRHDEEASRAGETARLEVLAHNPNVDEELLAFQFSERVVADVERRKAQRVPKPPNFDALPVGARVLGQQGRPYRMRRLARDLFPINGFAAVLAEGDPLAQRPEVAPGLPVRDDPEQHLGDQLIDGMVGVNLPGFPDARWAGRYYEQAPAPPAGGQPVAELPVQAVNPPVQRHYHLDPVNYIYPDFLHRRPEPMPLGQVPNAGYANQPEQLYQAPNLVLDDQQHNLPPQQVRLQALVDAAQLRRRHLEAGQKAIEQQRQSNDQRLRQIQETHQRELNRIQQLSVLIRAQRQQRNVRPPALPGFDACNQRNPRHYEPLGLQAQHGEWGHERQALAMDAAPANGNYWQQYGLSPGAWYGLGPAPETARGPAPDQAHAQAIAQAGGEVEAHGQAQVLDQIQENMRLLDQELLPALPRPDVQPQQDLEPQVPSWDPMDLLLEEGQGDHKQRPGQSADNPFVLYDDDEDNASGA